MYIKPERPGNVLAEKIIPRLISVQITPLFTLL